MPNAKYLAFGTPDENALKQRFMYLAFGTPDENALKQRFMVKLQNTSKTTRLTLHIVFHP